MVFAVQDPNKDRSEIEMTLELRTLWFEDLKKQDPQTSKSPFSPVYSTLNFWYGTDKTGTRTKLIYCTFFFTIKSSSALYCTE